MQSRAAALTATVDSQEAPGDSAGGPSAVPYTSAGADCLQVAGENAAYPSNISAQVAAEWGMDKTIAGAVGGVGIRPYSHDVGSNAEAAISRTVSAADSGGGGSVERKVSVRIEPGHTQIPSGNDQASIRSGDDESPLRGISPPNGSSFVPPEDEIDSRELPQPLVIASDATLMDGLRALLVHHLKRSVGSSVVSLSTSQAELLEHHLSRLASYAQKIVHTLAFATRFLSTKQNNEVGDNSHREGPHCYNGPGLPHNPQYANQAMQPQPSHPPPEQRPPRKSLKLSDDEILSIYRSAQVEAAIEADWRGIPAAAPRPTWAEGEGTTRSGVSATPPAVADSQGADQEYLRMFSRALQEPGRSPRALTAEILDPSRDAVCCRPNVPTMLNGGTGGPPTVHGSLQ